MGCYIDTGVRDLEGPYIATSDMTPEKCVRWCNLQDYSYAGVQVRTTSITQEKKSLVLAIPLKIASYPFTNVSSSMVTTASVVRHMELMDMMRVELHAAQHVEVVAKIPVAAPGGTTYMTFTVKLYKIYYIQCTLLQSSYITVLINST